MSSSQEWSLAVIFSQLTILSCWSRLTGIIAGVALIEKSEASQHDAGLLYVVVIDDTHIVAARACHLAAGRPSKPRRPCSCRKFQWIMETGRSALGILKDFLRILRDSFAQSRNEEHDCFVSHPPAGFHHHHAYFPISFSANRLRSTPYLFGIRLNRIPPSISLPSTLPFASFFSLRLLLQQFLPIARPMWGDM